MKERCRQNHVLSDPESTVKELKSKQGLIKSLPEFDLNNIEMHNKLTTIPKERKERMPNL